MGKPDETIEKARDEGYTSGSRMAWLTILAEAMRHLGDDKPDAAGLLAERAMAIQTLRSVCSDFGDNDWPDDLHLSDIIEKHLARHLSDRSS